MTLPYKKLDFRLNSKILYYKYIELPTNNYQLKMFHVKHFGTN